MLFLHHFLDYQARERADSEFAVQDGRAITYAEFNAECNRLSNALLAAGLVVGDRFAYLSKNSIDMLAAFFAASKTGTVVVPLNTRQAAPEWAYVIEHADAKLTFVQSDFVADLKRESENLASMTRFVAIGSAGCADSGPTVWQEYRAWVDVQSDEPPIVTLNANHALSQFYTSGTTGRPKGVVLTHHTMVASLIQGNYVANLNYAPGERCLLVMPLFHLGGMMQAIQAITGGGAIMIHASFDVDETLRCLAEERIASVLLVPAMIHAVLQQAEACGITHFEHLKLVLYGGSPIAESTLRHAMALFDCDFTQGFGQTETNGVITALSAEDHRRALQGSPDLLLSAGRPGLGTEVCIVDDQERQLPTGHSGEIVVRGPQCMQEYWKNPEETAATLQGGWLHTGDIGFLDEQGYLFIRDRKKDMIVSGGENVYSCEVENALRLHEAIADVAVIGVPDETFGETVMACVVRQPGATLTANEVMAFARTRLGGYKIPRRVEFVAELKRNASGKVLKNELRRPYWTGHTRLI